MKSLLAQLLPLLPAFVLLVAFLSIWLTVRGFRRKPPGFLRRTFLDARGEPNGTLLTAFWAVTMMSLCILTGLITSNWVPVHVWASLAGVLWYALKADKEVTVAQIQASDGALPSYSTTSSAVTDDAS